MSVRQKAIGVKWGISATAFGYAVSSGAATILKVVPTGASLRKTATKVMLKDKNGETNGAVIFDQAVEVTLRVYPSDTTIALSKTAGGAIGPAIGDRFEITDADDPDLAGTTYLVEELGKEETNDGVVTFEVTLKEYANNITTDTA